MGASIRVVLLLTNKAFTVFWVARTISFAGTGITMVVLPVLVYQMTGSPGWVAAVSAVEAGRLLEYSWSSPGEPTRPVRWEIAPEGDGTRLTLTLRVPSSEDPGRACAGWEAHLEMLEAALEGVPIKFPFERFKAARDGYREKVAGL